MASSIFATASAETISSAAARPLPRADVWETVNKPLAWAGDVAFDNVVGEAVAKAVEGIVSTLNGGASWSVRPGAVYEDCRADGHSAVRQGADIHPLDLMDAGKTVGYLMSHHINGAPRTRSVAFLAELRTAPAPLPLGVEIQDGRSAAVGHVVYQPREGGERDTGGASVTSRERAGENIGEGAPHVGPEGRRRRSRRGLGRRGSDGPVAVGFVPNFVPKTSPIMRNPWFRRRDSNPD
jgi:hypothetical protein